MNTTNTTVYSLLDGSTMKLPLQNLDWKKPSTSVTGWKWVYIGNRGDFVHFQNWMKNKKSWSFSKLLERERKAESGAEVALFRANYWRENLLGKPSSVPSVLDERLWWVILESSFMSTVLEGSSIIAASLTVQFICLNVLSRFWYHSEKYDSWSL